MQKKKTSRPCTEFCKCAESTCHNDYAENDYAESSDEEDSEIELWLITGSCVSWCTSYLNKRLESF